MNKESIEKEIKSMQPELTDDDCKDFVISEETSKIHEAMVVWQFLYPNHKDENDLKECCKVFKLDYENALKYKDYCLKELSKND